MSTSTTTKITVASTAAALLIGGGAFLLMDDSSSSSTGIDWSLYDLNVPKIALPTLNVPKLIVPTIPVYEINVSTGTVDLKTNDLNTSLASSSTQTSSLPKTNDSNSIVSIPDVSMPTVGVSSVSTSNVSVPDVSVPSVGVSITDTTVAKTSTTPNLGVYVINANINTPTVESESITTPSINNVALNTPSINNVALNASLGITSPLNLPFVISNGVVVPYTTTSSINIPNSNISSLSIPNAFSTQLTVDSTQAVGINTPYVVVNGYKVPYAVMNSAYAPQLLTTLLTIPNANGINLNTPAINESQVSIKTPNLMTVDTAIINLGSTFISNDSLASLNSSIKEIGKDTNEFAKTLLSLKPDDPTSDFPEWEQFIKTTNEVFRDKRMVSYDKTIIKSNTIINDWLEIYKEYKNKPDVKYIPIQKKFRMITEVRIPKTSKQLNILTENLKYYKSEGYDSVLVAFDKNDSPSEILNTIKYIIQYGQMNVWAAYSGKETLQESVFMDVQQYKLILQTIAPYIHGYVNSWRRTSAHLWAQDQEFMKFTNTVLRSINPNLPILGELYYGNTHKYDSVGNIGFEMNNFKNSSAVMIVNFGFKRIDVNYLFDTVLKPYIGNNPTVACVVGHKPYYMTTYKNGLDYKENMAIKHEVENRFLAKGCVGVITLSNDGKGLSTNNLSETLFSTLQ